MYVVAVQCVVPLKARGMLACCQQVLGQVLVHLHLIRLHMPLYFVRAVQHATCMHGKP